MSVLDESHRRPHKDYMKTLTITDAKKNLSRWLEAAARGEDIGIVSGANIIALRRVDVESTHYAQRKYGATRARVASLGRATDRRYRNLKRAGKLVISAPQLRRLLQ